MPARRQETPRQANDGHGERNGREQGRQSQDPFLPIRDPRQDALEKAQKQMVIRPVRVLRERRQQAVIRCSKNRDRLIVFDLAGNVFA